MIVGAIVWAWAKPLLLRFGVYIAIAAAVAGFYFYKTHQAYEQGRTDATEVIAEANREADRKAAQGEDAVAKCYRAGKRWVRVDGACQ